MSSFCPKCGAQLADNQLFCGSCGTSLQAPQQAPQPMVQQPVQPAAQPNYNPNYNQGYQGQPYMQNMYQPNQGQAYYGNPYQANAQPQIPMNWFKFIIFFQLFASAAMNLVSAASLFNEIDELKVFRGMFKSMNAYVDKCSTANTIMAIVCIMLAGCAIFVRFQLSGYKKKGPALYLSYLGIVAVANLVYIIATISFVQALYDSVGGTFDISEFSSYIGQIIMHFVLLIANIVYFKKRKFLFVK